MTWEWLDPDEWVRDSRGRSWTFELPTLSIMRVMAAVASARDDDLDLLTCSPVKMGPIYRSIYRQSPWTALDDHEEWEHFIRSRRLTPALPAPTVRSDPSWPTLFATNGLLALQHPDPFRPRDDPIGSNLGMVTRVRNVGTEKLRVHTGYDELYRRLKRELAREVRRVSGKIASKQ